MNRREVLEYYSRKDVQEAILDFAGSREVVGAFPNGSYSQRPNTLMYPKDIESLARSGIVELHCSVERWTNPTALKEGNYNSLRKGWDLVLDLDCVGKKTEHGILAAKAVLKTLEEHAAPAAVKFTGGSGFHLIIPWESMPKDVGFKKTEKLFPDFARTIAGYLKEKSKEHFQKLLLAEYSIEELAKQTGQKPEDIKTPLGIDPYKIVDIDSVLLSPRHLFRMPYSLNKRGLVSIPVEAMGLGGFDPESARPGKVKAKPWKLPEGDASLLFAEAADWKSIKEKDMKEQVKRRAILTKRIPAEIFPPCIKNILEGIEDGKKRSIFILVNFLKSVNWPWEDIEKAILEWNQKNKPPIKEGYLRTAMKWHSRKPQLPPPNCKAKGYYQDFLVCHPDHICGGQAKTIKNPLNYPLKQLKIRKKTRKRSLQGRSSSPRK